MNEKSKIIFPALLILFIGSTIQFGEYTINRYFIPLCATILSTLAISLANSSINEEHIIFFKKNIFIFFLFLIVTSIGNINFEYFIFDFIKLSFAFLISSLAYYLVSTVNSNHLNISMHFLFISSLLFLYIELPIRFFITAKIFDQPILKILTTNFYELKVNSPFMSDSNGIALYAIFYVCILIGYKKFTTYTNKKFDSYKYYLILFFISIFLTFSRSAIITFFLILFLSYFFTLKTNTKLFIFLIFAVSLFLLSPILITTISNDGSGSTKLKVIINLLQTIDSINILNLFFGHGTAVGNYTFSYENGAYAHLLVPLLIGQFGLIGFILYFSYFLYNFEIKYNIVIVATFILGLSYLPPFFETIFLAYGTIAGLYSRLNRSCCITETSHKSKR